MKANFFGSVFHDVFCDSCIFTGATMENCDMAGLKAYESEWAGANARNARFDHALIAGSLMSTVDFEGASLIQVARTRGDADLRVCAHVPVPMHRPICPRAS